MPATSRILESTNARTTAVFFCLFLLVNTLTRIVLMAACHRHLSWDGSLFEAFFIGIAFDTAAGLFAILPIGWVIGFLPDRILHSKAGKIAIIACLTAFLNILVFVATAEWLFWDEFGARFNFIAVDYLVWTQEVFGNISQSYPLGIIFPGIVLVCALMIVALKRAGILAWIGRGNTGMRARLAWPIGTLTATAAIAFCASHSTIPAFNNAYHVEIAKNGYWSFVEAFCKMELDYNQWYTVLPHEEAMSRTKEMLNSPEEATSPVNGELLRSVQGHGEEHRWNVILVCMESMSGEYLSYVGKDPTLTPNLNRLAEQSLFFENLYATGTRTVRGMEALTLNLPPTPGQAIIYRPEGTDLVTTFSPFLNRGYDCTFLYGGDGRFDFMNRYFSTAGCRIMDVTAWKPGDVTFRTAWGACDEDLFNKTIEQADTAYASGTPFHFFCMTTSNHRPYLFPEGRIDMPSKSKRLCAVKYADWAIGNLIENAQKHPWFKDTLFVICSDHCASSAGKVELNVPKYRIPAMIYNPNLIQPRKITTLASQIDVMPTLFGQLGWSYPTLGYGHDLLLPSVAGKPGRAFVSNYQKLGMLTDDSIVILNPNRRAEAYTCNHQTGLYSEISQDKAKPLIHDTTAYYQSASWLFDSGGLKKKNQIAKSSTQGELIH